MVGTAQSWGGKIPTETSGFGFLELFHCTDRTGGVRGSGAGRRLQGMSQKLENHGKKKEEEPKSLGLGHGTHHSVQLLP